MAIKRHSSRKTAQPRAARSSRRHGREYSKAKRKKAAHLKSGGSQRASEEVYESGISPLSVVSRANDSTTSAFNR